MKRKYLGIGQTYDSQWGLTVRGRGVVHLWSLSQAVEYLPVHLGKDDWDYEKPAKLHVPMVLL